MAFSTLSSMREEKQLCDVVIKVNIYMSLLCLIFYWVLCHWVYTDYVHVLSNLYTCITLCKCVLELLGIVLMF